MSKFPFLNNFFPKYSHLKLLAGAIHVSDNPNLILYDFLSLIDLDDSFDHDDVLMAGSLNDDERGQSIMMSPEDCLGLDLGILLATDHIITSYRSID